MVLSSLLVVSISNVRFDEGMVELSDIPGTTDAVKQTFVFVRVRVCVLCSPESLCISTKLDKSALIHMRETRFSRVIAHHETD